MKRLLYSFLLSITLLGTILYAQVNQVWVAEFNGTGNGLDNSYSMTIDQSANIYVTGESSTAAGNNDCVTIKYDANGDTVWVRYYDGPAHSRDIGRAIAVDANGNVYVTGESSGTINYDIVTIKYNSAGVQQWATVYDGPANGAEGSSAIAIDTSGNVYVTGYSDGDASPVFRQDDYVTIKYNSSGTEVWVSRYDGPSNYHDTPNAIAVDKNGNVYVTGGSSGSGTRYDYATVKYSSGGSELWVKSYNGPANYDDVAYAIAVDDAGNVYVTGSSDGASSDNEDYATIKYNTDGVQQWLVRYDGGGGGDEAYAMVLNENNNLYVTGKSRSPVTPYSYDYLTVRYNADTGDTVWTARYDGPASELDIPLSVTTDNLENVYVTGYCSGNGTGYDYTSLKYNSLGAEQWIASYNGQGNGNDLSNGIAVDTSGNVYVSGSSLGNGTLNDIVTIKYSQSVNGVILSDLNSPENFSLLQNYPNPFNPSTKIKFTIPQDVRSEMQEVSLIIDDVLGNKVATLVNEEKPAGTYEVEFKSYGLPSGVYFYTLSVGNYIETKKMTLLK